MVALAVNLCKRHESMSHACPHTKSLHVVQFVVVKQLTRLAKLAISVTSIGQSRSMTASGSACLDIWPHAFEAELLGCNGRRGPILESRQHRVSVIAAASLAEQSELRACGNLCELVSLSKTHKPTLKAQICCQYFWQYRTCHSQRRKRVALGVALE